jgi:long-chain acyl-CoA synthetase
MSPQLDLNVDSFEWMNLSLEILEETGIELNEQSIAKIGTLRDLLSEVASMSAKEKGNTQTPVQNPEAFISKEQAKWLQPLNPIQTALSGCLYGLVWFIMRVFFRVSPRREERLPARQTVFIPNHASYLDVFSLISVLPFSRMRNTQIAAWVGIAFANSFFSFLSRLGQTFPVDPKNSLITSIALAAAVLRKGKSLIWFPEGERTLSGELLPFRPGIGILLEDMELPVVPVYLRGTREALPPGAYLPRFFKEVTVVFGASVLPSQLISEGHGKTTAERIANALHDRVESLSRSGSSYSSSKGVRARQSKRNGLGKTTASSK